MRVKYLELFIVKNKIKNIIKKLIFTDTLGMEEGDRYCRPCPQFLRKKKEKICFDLLNYRYIFIYVFKL
jgi:hypothetical protein